MTGHVYISTKRNKSGRKKTDLVNVSIVVVEPFFLFVYFCRTVTDVAVTVTVDVDTAVADVVRPQNLICSPHFKWFYRIASYRIAYNLFHCLQSL